MRRDKFTENLQRATLTRRQVINGLVSVGLGAGPLASSLASAREIDNTSNTRMVAAIFFESYATLALRRALRYAGGDGFVASMPQLLHARVNAPYDNIIWNTWFTANSEESVVTTPQGNHVVVAVHGGGLFASPERLERSLRADLSRTNSEGLTGQYAAKISDDEVRGLLKGQLPNGLEFPVFPFAEFRRGISDLPRRYAVVLDYDLARQSKSGYESFDVLKDDPNMIVRAGGVEPLVAYLDKARNRNNTKLMGHWHSYNRIDPAQAQTRIPELGGTRGGTGSEGEDQDLGRGLDVDYGITGGGAMADLARYVAVAPRNVSTSLQYVDFEL